MKVLFFAQSRVAAGCESHVLDVGKAITVSELWDALIKVCPALASVRKSARLARNETYLSGDETLHPDDEIAVIPPVSGG